MTVYFLPLPYDKPPLSLNQRMHWAQTNKWKNQIHSDVIVLAMKARLPKAQQRADIVLQWHPSMRRNRDTDNPTPTLKACIDGLVKYGLVPDDSSLIVSSHCEIGELRVPAQMLLRVEVP